MKMELTKAQADSLLKMQITDLIHNLNECRELLNSGKIPEAYKKFDFELFNSLPNNLEEYVNSYDL